MKKLLLPALLASCCNVYAQNQLDNYFSGNSTFTEIGNAMDGLTNPHDLDFVPNRPNELWVLNKETFGGSVVIYFDAGMNTQSSQYRQDSHHEHFMARAVAMAFGDNDYFVTAQEIQSTAGPTSTFMGPCLWSSDTSIFARQHQNNWVPGQLLGSHIDMLHQSPYGMGVAHDHANVYWYFDGHNGNICKYDFATPHGVGEDDHSDGRIHRYTDVTVTRKPNMPSHMALDKANNWLYIVDGGANRVIRMKTTSGTIAGNLTVPASGGEPLTEYKEVTGATVEVVVSTGLTSPCGIDYRNGRIAVTDNATGNIHIYDVTGSGTATEVGQLITGGPGVMGVKIDDNNKIWYVNETTRRVMRVDNPNVLAVPNVAEQIKFAVYPNPATNVVNVKLDEVKPNEAAKINVYDAAGRSVYTTSAKTAVTSINTTGWAKGIYTVSVSYSNANAVSKVVIR